MPRKPKHTHPIPLDTWQRLSALTDLLTRVAENDLCHLKYNEAMVIATAAEKIGMVVETIAKRSLAETLRRATQ